MLRGVPIPSLLGYNVTMDKTEVMQLPHLGDSNQPGYYKTENGERLTLWWWDGESYDEWGEHLYEALISWED